MTLIKLNAFLPDGARFVESYNIISKKEKCKLKKLPRGYILALPSYGLFGFFLKKH